MRCFSQLAPNLSAPPAPRICTLPEVTSRTHGSANTPLRPLLKATSLKYDFLKLRGYEVFGFRYLLMAQLPHTHPALWFQRST